MPRVKLGYYNKPAEQRAKEEELREKFGGAMNAKDVGWYLLGISDRQSYMLWLEDIPSIAIVGKKRRYPVEAVAKKWYDSLSLIP